MTRPLGKSLFVLLALSLWNLAGSTSLAEDDDPNGVKQLIEQGRYQEAIPIAERAVEVAKRVRGPEHPETADALNNLGLVFEKIGDSAKAEPLFQEALRIRQKVLGPEHPVTAQSLNKLGSLYRDVHEYAKAALRGCLIVRRTGSSRPERNMRRRCRFAVTWPKTSRRLFFCCLHDSYDR